MQVSAKLRRGDGRYFHWCPGCDEMHPLPDGWTFNGNVERPTFDPSFRQGGVRRIFADGKWTGEWVRDAEGKPVPLSCHYMLIDGQLQFQADSNHALAGKTVPLPDLPLGAED